MKKRHPLIAILLVFAMIFVMMPAPVSAASSVTVKTAQELANALSDSSADVGVVLGADIQYSVSEYGQLDIGGNTGINCNGHNITFTDGIPFNVEDTGILTFVKADINAITLVENNYGTLIIESTAGEGIYVSDYIVYSNYEEGEVRISDSTIRYCEYSVEYNYGDVELTNLTVEDSYYVFGYNYGNCTMTDITAEVDYAVVDENYSSMTFNNLKIDANYYTFPIEDQYDDYCDTYGIPSCIINGGTFEGEYMNCCFYGYGEINGGAKFVAEDYLEIYSYDCETTFVINDADFTVEYDNVFYVSGDDATLAIYGGRFEAASSSGYNVIDVGGSYETVILAGGTFITAEGGEVLDDDYSYLNYIIPDGYVTIPEDWQHTSTLTIIPPLYRYSGKNRYETAIKAADALKEQLGVEKFDSVILACGSNYADALAGSYLATVKNAPILLVDNLQSSIDLAQAYINNNLKPNGAIFILGGTGAVPDSAVAGLTGFTVTRLKGKDRYETNIAILEEAGVTGNEFLVCSGTGFADSLSASAVGKPILLVGASIMDSQKSYVQSLSGKEFYIIGGKGAVSLDLESYFSSLGTTTRIGGSNRFETSANVAKTFFTEPNKAVLAYAMNFPDGLSGGPLAYAMGGPLLLVSNGFSAKASEYAYEANIRVGSVLGGTSLISDDEVRNVFHLASSIEVIKK